MAAPLIDVKKPAAGANASSSGQVTVGMTHDDGIWLSSTKIWIRRSPTSFWDLAFDGSNASGSRFQSGYDGALSSVAGKANGYNIVVDPVIDFAVGATVSVYVRTGSKP